MMRAMTMTSTDPRQCGRDVRNAEVVKEGAIDWLTLNRPKALNAMSRTMMLELQHYFGELYTDHSVRVVVLTGAGRGFCAGLDLKEDRGDEGTGPVGGLRVQRRVSEIVMRMRRAPQPIIALINGPASGGGFALALASDIRIAAPAARMNAAFIRIGLTACDVGVSYFLPRLVGSALASELLLTGRFIDAGARRTGRPRVAGRRAGRDCSRPGERWRSEILANSPIGVRLTKECLNMSIDAGGLEAVIAMEDRQQILVAQTGDMREGVGAFLEKRKPRLSRRLRRTGASGGGAGNEWQRRVGRPFRHRSVVNGDVVVTDRFNANASTVAEIPPPQYVMMRSAVRAPTSATAAATRRRRGTTDLRGRFRSTNCGCRECVLDDRSGSARCPRRRRSTMC